MTRSLDTHIDFILREKGEDINIRGIHGKAIVADVRDNPTYYDDKMLRTDMEIWTGDIVEYQSKDWIVISEIDKNTRSYRGRIRKVNYDIKIVVDEVLCEFPTIIKGISLGIEEGGTLSFESGRIETIMPQDMFAENIDVGARFIKMGNVWKVVGVDKTKPGLITLYSEKDLVGSNDDMDSEIANKNHIATWDIQINEATRQISKGVNMTFTATVLKNGIAYAEEVVIWETSDESIAKVLNGVVTGVSAGKALMTASILGKPSISASIEIEVLDKVPDVITYKMWNSYSDGSGKTYTEFSIKFGSSRFYGVEKYINGVLAENNDTYTFVLDPNDAYPGEYIFNVVDSHKIKLDSEGYGFTVILTATSNESGAILTERIVFGGLW